jgi:hypothetical protein
VTGDVEQVDGRVSRADFALLTEAECLKELARYARAHGDRDDADRYANTAAEGGRVIGATCSSTRMGGLRVRAGGRKHDLDIAMREKVGHWQELAGSARERDPAEACDPTRTNTFVRLARC